MYKFIDPQFFFRQLCSLSFAPAVPKICVCVGLNLFFFFSFQLFTMYMQAVIYSLSSPTAVPHNMCMRRWWPSSFPFLFMHLFHLYAYVLTLGCFLSFPSAVPHVCVCASHYLFPFFYCSFLTCTCLLSSIPSLFLQRFYMCRLAAIYSLSFSAAVLQVHAGNHLFHLFPLAVPYVPGGHLLFSFFSSSCSIHTC